MRNLERIADFAVTLYAVACVGVVVAYGGVRYDTILQQSSAYVTEQQSDLLTELQLYQDVRKARSKAATPAQVKYIENTEEALICAMRQDAAALWPSQVPAAVSEIINQ